MDKQKIQLRKVRTFSDCISDTFELLRQNGKSIFKSFVLISGIFLLVTCVLSGFNQSNIISYGLRSAGSSTNNPFSVMFTPLYFAVIAAGIMSYIAMNVVVASYYKLYEQGNDNPSVNEVWKVFSSYFLKCFIGYIPVMLLIAAGTVFLIVPGIYMAIAFTPFIFVLVTEDASIGDAISRCFSLTKNNFWSSFGLYFVTYMIVAVIAGAIGFIISLITGMVTYLTTKDVSNSLTIGFAVFSALSYLTYVILFMVVGMQYYSLAEKLDGTGLQLRIDNLGTHQTQQAADIEEQY